MKIIRLKGFHNDGQKHLNYIKNNTDINVIKTLLPIDLFGRIIFICHTSIYYFLRQRFLKYVYTLIDNFLNSFMILPMKERLYSLC